MIKRIAVYSLREGTDPNEFWKYVKEEHDPDFVRVSGSRLKKFINQRITKVLSGDPKFWVLSETWWENEEAMEEAFKEVNTIKNSRGKTIRADFLSRVTGVFIAIVGEEQVVP